MTIRADGRISWFGGPRDSSDSGHTALGLTTAVPGISVYNRHTLGGYWWVKLPNGKSGIERQTDIGPAPWTGKSVDFTYSVLGKYGYGEGNFPTGAHAQAVFLGHGPNHARRQATRLGLRVTSGPGGLPVSGGGAARAAAPSVQGLGSSNPNTMAPDLTPGGSGLTTLIAGQQAAPQRVASPVSAIPMPSFSAAYANPGQARLPMVGAPTPPQDTLGSQLAGLQGLRGPDISQGAQSPQIAAGGRSTGARAPAKASAGRWAHPIGGSFTQGRTDNGVDFETRPGTPLRAIGPGVIVNLDGNFPGGSVVLKLDHPQSGHQYVYYGHLNGGKKVRVGQRVNGGDVVAVSSARPAGAEDMPGHTEIGFARDQSGTIQTGGHAEGPTSWGNYFAHIIQRLPR